MGIEALPQATVRVLGASQVLTDPAAVVKELLDNAYDANATSIAVEIHNNTIDVIQVRDNGHGVAPQDRPLIARRYCTSKISHDSELKDIGGSSLGFRGEALASAAELSGSLTISTRIEGEQVAAALKISQKGEVVGQEKASLPVGTTVRITDFIKSNPVRRQVVLKGTENCLKKIKRTLQAYAFARPHVRLSLRVLKAKNTKSDWVYAPKLDGNAEDATFKVVGAACASQCMWSVLESGGFSFHAFLPCLDADPGKISNVGPFISVDARPVSAARGIFKQVSKIFREALKSSAAASLVDLKDPFLYLEIQCPRGSYDANLEPAKDDLLFEDADVVIDTARRLFAMAYERQSTGAQLLRPETADMPRQQLQQDLDKSASNIPDRTSPGQARRAHAQFEDLGAFADLESGNGVHDPASSMDCNEELPTSSTYRSNMYGCDEEDLGVLDQRTSTSHSGADFAELRRSKGDVTASNPWIAAKLNASVRRPMPVAEDQTYLRNRSINAELMTPVTSSSPLKQSTIASAALPTPRPSSPSPAHHDGFHPSDHIPDIRLARDGRVIGSSALPRPEPYTPMSSASTYRHPEYNYATTSDDSRGTPLEAIPDISSKRRRNPRRGPYQGQTNRPFVTPMTDPSSREKVWFDHLQGADGPRAPSTKRRKNAFNDHAGLVVQGELGDLVEDPRPMTPPLRNRDIRDFVGREVDASVGSIIAHDNRTRAESALRVPRSEREVLDLSGDDAADGRPHQTLDFVPASEILGLSERMGSQDQMFKRVLKRRKNSERRALQEVDLNAVSHEPSKERTTFDEEEYQPAAGKRMRSRRKSSSKLGRTKSSKLPLERIPPGKGTHDLAVTCSTSSQNISRMTEKPHIANALLGFNEPALPMADGMDSASSHLLSLAASLHGLLVSAGGDVDSPGLAALLSEVKTAFAERREVHEDEMLMPSGT